MRKPLFNMFLLVFTSLSFSLNAQITYLMFGSNKFVGLTIKDSIIYMGYGNSVATMNVNNPVNLNYFCSASMDVTGMAFHGSDLYVSNGYEIKKSDSLGTWPTTDVLSNMSDLYGLAFHGDTLYISQPNAGIILKMNVTLPSPVLDTLLSTNLISPRRLIVLGDELLITEDLGNRISRVDLTVPNSTPSVILNSDKPHAFTLDGSILYYSKFQSDTIEKIDLNDSIPTPIFVGHGAPNTNDMFFFNDEIYMTFWYVPWVSSISKLSLNFLKLKDDLLENVITFPNPAASYVHVEGAREGQIFTLQDMLGNILKKGLIDNEKKIMIQDLPRGCYLLRLDSGKSTRIIKE